MHACHAHSGGAVTEGHGYMTEMDTCVNMRSAEKPCKCCIWILFGIHSISNKHTFETATHCQWILVKQNLSTLSV